MKSVFDQMDGYDKWYNRLLNGGVLGLFGEPPIPDEDRHELAKKIKEADDAVAAVDADVDEVDADLVELESVDPELIQTRIPDPAADALAQRINGVSRVRFSADGPNGREYDAVSDRYVAQTKPENFSLGSQFRNQAKATFEKAIETNRTPYFHFQGQPQSGVLQKLAEYSERYGVEPVIDLDALDVAE